jgi:hypothetical protein
VAVRIPKARSNQFLTPGLCLIMLRARMTTRHDEWSMNRAAPAMAMRLRTTWTMGLLLLLSLLVVPVTAEAQFTFTTNNGTLTITGYSGPGGAVTIPDTSNGLAVVSVGVGAFLGCTSLTSITIGNSVASIGGIAFDKCSSLTSVTIPASVTNIGDLAFGYCTSLSAIKVDTANPFYSSVDGVLFDKSQTTLVECPGGKAGSYTVPNGIISIGDNAFSGCASLTSITIPSSVLTIGSAAFWICTNLTTIYFQGNAPSVDSPVFNAENYLVVYYLPGTTGWGPFFGGPFNEYPAVLWNPQVQPGSPGIQTNQFGFTLSGSSNLVVVIEATTNLANPTWSPVQTNTLNGSPLYFNDPQWTNYGSRFYRITWP